MGRAPCCSKVGLHRGPWTPREDTMLINYIQTHGEGHWRSLPKKAGLLRCGKSCRLRWMNYLRPDIKRGNITPEEDDLIIRMHSLLGNRWSLIAGRLPGRTDNEIKNYWNTHLRKKLKTQGTDPDTKKHSPSSNQSLVIKKKKKNATNKKPDNTRSKPKRTEPEKQKIHLPKPVRVTSLLALPRKDRFEGNISQGSDINNNNVYNDHNNNGVNFLVGDDNGNLVNGSHLDRCESIAPAASIARDNNSLERLYEEYLQLLETDHEDQVQLDSFAESLLI